MMKNRQYTLISFPILTSMFGGAEWVKIEGRSAYIKLPGPCNEKPVRMPLSELPDQSHWTAFTLADAAEKWKDTSVSAAEALSKMALLNAADEGVALGTCDED